MANDDLPVDAAALQASNDLNNLAGKASKITKTTLILIVGLVLTFVILAALTIPKVIQNSDQEAKLKELQIQIDNKAKILEGI